MIVHEISYSVKTEIFFKIYTYLLIITVIVNLNKLSLIIK